MKRILGLLLALALSGCALVGGSEWDRVEVAFSGAADGNYTLVVTPTKATYTIEGKKSSHDLPDGAWPALRTGVAALGERTSKPCDGPSVAIKALAGDAVKQVFQASSCDGGEALAQAQAVLAQIIAQLR